MIITKPVGDANPHHSGFVSVAMHQAVGSVVEMGIPAGGVEHVGGRQRNIQSVKEDVADFEVQVVAERGGELRMKLRRNDVIVCVKHQIILVSSYRTVMKFY